jgi:hypothetical protein
MGLAPSPVRIHAGSYSSSSVAIGTGGAALAIAVNMRTASNSFGVSAKSLGGANLNFHTKE